jgi:hypothetical protein
VECAITRPLHVTVARLGIKAVKITDLYEAFAGVTVATHRTVSSGNKETKPGVIVIPVTGIYENDVSRFVR